MTNLVRNNNMAAKYAAQCFVDLLDLMKEQDINKFKDNLMNLLYVKDTAFDAFIKAYNLNS